MLLNIYELLDKFMMTFRTIFLLITKFSEILSMGTLEYQKYYLKNIDEIEMKHYDIYTNEIQKKYRKLFLIQLLEKSYLITAN